MAIVAIIVSVLDNIIPALGAKKYGAEKISVWLALLGTLVGILFFPPWGIFIGAFLGALLGELLHSVIVRNLSTWLTSKRDEIV